MGCKVPAHDRRGRKLSYKDWIRLRDLMDALRRHGLSWTDISLRAGKKNRGWAAKTYYHRSNARADDLRVLEEILDEVQSEVWKIERSIQEEESAVVASEMTEDATAEAVSTPATETQEEGEMVAPAAHEHKTTHEITPEEAKIVLNVIEHLRAAGRSKAEIARLLGYTNGTNPTATLNYVIKTGGYVSRERYDDARRLWELIQEEKEIPPPISKPPARNKSTGWEWMDRVQDKLLEAAVIVENAASQVPETFRGPYYEKLARIEELIEEFQH